MRHHAFLVTTYNARLIQEAHEKAEEIFGTLVSEINESLVNGYSSFAVFPDGSKEGWEDSDQGDLHRGEFRDWLNRKQYEDKSSPFDWVWLEVQYGDDRLETRIVTDSDEGRRQRLLEEGEIGNQAHLTEEQWNDLLLYAHVRYGEQAAQSVKAAKAFCDAMSEIHVMSTFTSLQEVSDTLMALAHEPEGEQTR